MSAPTCSCGDAAEHIVARRMTADCFSVVMLSRGAIVGGFGHAFNGVPFARPRSAEGLALALRAGWLLMGEVELYDVGELGDLYAAAKRVAARGGLPGDLRAEMHRAAPPSIPLRWTVLSADRDGKPTCRVATLPRLRWPATQVWHERGVYEVLYEQCGALHSSGRRFTSQRDLFAFLLSPEGKVTVTSFARGSS